MLRPDLVDCWIYRLVRGSTPVSGPAAQAPNGAPAAQAPNGAPAAEILLLRRSPGRILAGLWQCVSGSLEPGERIAEGALRELAEETAFGPAEIEAFYDLDLVNAFHEPSVDAVLSAAVFAVRVGAAVEPRLSHEHDDQRWLPIDTAIGEVVWPGYRTAIERIRDDLLRPDREPWFRLTPAGRRDPV